MSKLSIASQSRQSVPDEWFLEKAPLIARDRLDERINNYSAKQHRQMWSQFADDESRPEYVAWPN